MVQKHTTLTGTTTSSTSSTLPCWRFYRTKPPGEDSGRHKQRLTLTDMFVADTVKASSWICFLFNDLLGQGLIFLGMILKLYSLQTVPVSKDIIFSIFHVVVLLNRIEVLKFIYMQYNTKAHREKYITDYVMSTSQFLPLQSAAHESPRRQWTTQRPLLCLMFEATLLKRLM